MEDENRLLSDELRILRCLDLDDHAQTAQDVGKLHEEMMRLKERNELLEYKMRRIEKEEYSLSQNVDLDDKLALKKLVVMLKMKNDKMMQNGNQNQNQNRPNK